MYSCQGKRIKKGIENSIILSMNIVELSLIDHTENLLGNVFFRGLNRNIYCE